MLFFTHQGRHAGSSKPGRRRHHGSHPVREELPEKFWPLRAYAERKARGLWVDPRYDDMMRALRRDYEQWRRQSPRRPR